MIENLFTDVEIQFSEQVSEKEDAIKWFSISRKFDFFWNVKTEYNVLSYDLRIS